MSLMLDALKRIESRQVSARTFVACNDQKCEPPLTVVTAEPSERDWQDSSTNDHEAGPFDASIELPSELKSDPLADFSLDDIALPDDVSLEAAMNDLSALLAEARLVDQPVEVESLVAPEPPEKSIDFSSQEFGQYLDAPPQLEIASDAPADTVASQREPEGALSKDFSRSPEPSFEAANPASEEASAVLPAVEKEPGFDVTAAVNPDQAFIPQREAVTHAAAVAFPDAPVIKPLGSDPYAATAWQILRQLPQNRSQVLQFTSPGDGHGKTVTLARLLPHMARTFEGSVLVVDANTRNPDLARRLDVAVTWRLTDVLSGATHWMNAVRATSLPRVSLLPGGLGTLRRHDVRAAAGLLRELAGHYDLVLVDATSLAHEGAAQLSGTCDGTCLVVRLGEGSRRTVRESLQVIDNAGGRLLGCIAIDAGE
jgi:Mrp family chromosome partitioning ATPase